MKVEITKIFDTVGIGCYCMSCGKNLGHIEYVKEHSSFNHPDMMPLCNNCFSEKIGKPVSCDKIQHPFH